MRTIKFRGKKEETGEWVYGFFAFLHMSDPNDSDQITRGITSIPSIFNDDYGRSKNCWNTVVQKTVGQFVGVYDKNGKEVYEGDIVDCWSEGRHCTNGIVKWIQNRICIGVTASNGNVVDIWHLMPNNEGIDEGLTIIGNIHDNPKLLEGGEK